jgi:sugar lactone lactonase YvrE
MAILGSGRFTYEVTGENWGNLPEGWYYKEATAVDVDSKDNVYVFNRGNHPMIVFDSEGEVIRSWGEGEFTNPHGVTVAPDDTLWLVDNGDHSIRHFTAEGKHLSTLAEKNNAAPKLSGKPVNGPTRVAIDPRNGEILVGDGYGNARVHRYSPDGKTLLNSWGEPGTDPGQFVIVHDIAVDKDGWIFIGDRENRRVQIFSPEGKFETQWVNFSRAAGVHISKNDEQLVYVAEYLGDPTMIYRQASKIGPRISVLDRGGNLLARLGEETYGDEPGRFYAPHYLSTDSKGNIYEAEVSYAEYGGSMDPPRELRSLQKLVLKN